MLKSEPYYWVECDSCGARARTNGDVCDEERVAEWYAEEDGWSVIGGRHFCGDCDAPWCSECGKDYGPDRQRDVEKTYMCEECAQS